MKLELHHFSMQTCMYTLKSSRWTIRNQIENNNGITFACKYIIMCLNNCMKMWNHIKLISVNRNKGTKWELYQSAKKSSATSSRLQRNYTCSSWWLWEWRIPHLYDRYSKLDTFLNTSFITSVTCFWIFHWLILQAPRCTLYALCLLIWMTGRWQ